MRFFFLTALLLFRISLVDQTGQYSFSQPDDSVPSHNLVNAILKGADGLVWFGVMRRLTVMTDIAVSFHKQHDVNSQFRRELGFCRDWCKLFPKLKLIQCVS